MQRFCTHSMTPDSAEPVREELHLMRRRMVLDLEWFLSQSLAAGPSSLANPPQNRMHGILILGHSDEGQQPW
jgi:hypothetical protein